MTVIIKWEVAAVFGVAEENGMQNVVKALGWDCVATYQENNTLSNRATGFTLLNPPDTTKFLQYETLKKSDLLEWLMNSVDKETVETYLTNSLKDAPMLSSIPGLVVLPPYFLTP